MLWRGDVTGVSFVNGNTVRVLQMTSPNITLKSVKTI